MRLSDYAETIANPDSPASGTFEIVGASPQVGDRLTIWYLNLSFDYIVTGAPHTTLRFYIDTPHAIYAVTLGGHTFSYTLRDGDSASTLVQSLVDAINSGSAVTGVSAAAGSGAGQVDLTLLSDPGEGVAVSATGNADVVLRVVQAATVAQELAKQINAMNYDAVQAPFGLQAVADDAKLTITTTRGGYDANFIRLLAVNATDTLKTSQTLLQLDGGASSATLRVNYDFSVSLGPALAQQIRKMWLTFAPQLADAKEFVSQEWHASFQQLDRDRSRRRAATASAGAVQLLDWSHGQRLPVLRQLERRGWFLPGWAGQAGADWRDGHRSVHQCLSARPMAGDRIERLGRRRERRAGLGRSDLVGSDVTTGGGVAVTTRKLLFAQLPPGHHKLTLTVASGTLLLDHLIVCVPVTDTPALPAQSDLSAALDYSTDHTYKLPPARILWLFNKLGLVGPVNQYIGVFWWNQRQLVGAQTNTANVSFAGSFIDGDQIFLSIGGQVCGKTVRAPDTPAEHRAALCELHQCDLCGGVGRGPTAPC